MIEIRHQLERAIEMNTMTRTVLIAVVLGGLSSISVFHSHSKVTQTTGKSEEKVIRISAKRFEFSPNTITLKKGEPVVFEITSEDRTHGFRLKDFDIRGEVKPGEPTRIPFTPDKTGEFTFSCDVVCGGGHAEMFGKLVVTD